MESETKKCVRKLAVIRKGGTPTPSYPPSCHHSASLILKSQKADIEEGQFFHCNCYFRVMRKGERI